MRFGAGATRKSPLVAVFADATGVAATPSTRVARLIAAVIPGAPLRSMPGTAIGGKPETSVAGRYGERDRSGTTRWRSSGVTMACPIRRSYAARRDAGTGSTHAAAEKRAGLSHRNAFLVNWSLVTPVPLESSMNRRRLSVSEAACAMRPRICTAATSARRSASRRTSRSASTRAAMKPRTVTARNTATRAMCRFAMPIGLACTRSPNRLWSCGLDPDAPAPTLAQGPISRWAADPRSPWSGIGAGRPPGWSRARA